MYNNKMIRIRVYKIDEKLFDNLEVLFDQLDVTVNLSTLLVDVKCCVLLH